MTIVPPRGDIIAGLSVAGLLLPEAVAYASQRLTRAGCTLVLARVKQDILDALGRMGSQGVSLQSRSYFSVADAFDRARHANLALSVG
jgi:MFS superfamily sulfate permease-like transporter